MIAFTEQGLVDKLDQPASHETCRLSAQAVGARSMIPIALPFLEREEADAARRLPHSNGNSVLWLMHLMHARSRIARPHCTSP
jgi:hypothetical protein